MTYLTWNSAYVHRECSKKQRTVNTPCGKKKGLNSEPTYSKISQLAPVSCNRMQKFLSHSAILFLVQVVIKSVIVKFLTIVTSSDMKTTQMKN